MDKKLIYYVDHCFVLILLLETLVSNVLGHFNICQTIGAYSLLRNTFTLDPENMSAQIYVQNTYTIQ